MSGGSMDYLCYKVEEATFRLDTAMRRAFAKKMNLFAKCLHAIEWNDSGDGDSKEDELLRELLGPHAELEQLISEARAAQSALAEAIAEAEKGQP